MNQNYGICYCKKTHKHWNTDSACNITSVSYIYDGNRRHFYFLQFTRSKFTATYKFFQKQLIEAFLVISRITESASVSKNKLWKLQNQLTIWVIKTGIPTKRADRFAFRIAHHVKLIVRGYFCIKKIIQNFKHFRSMMGWMHSPSRALWDQQQQHKLQKYLKFNPKLQNLLFQQNTKTLILQTLLVMLRVLPTFMAETEDTLIFCNARDADSLYVTNFWRK